MFSTLPSATLAAAVSVLAVAACTDVENEEPLQQREAEAGHGAGHGHGGHGPAVAEPKSLAAAWVALREARDAIARDIETGALANIHTVAEALPGHVAALREHASELDAPGRARVEGAAVQIARIADALHGAADRGDAARSRTQLARLDRLLELIRAQLPDGALSAAPHAHGDPSAAPHHDHAAHRPAGVVDAAPKSTVRIQALDPFRFEPRRIEVHAGVPTRIELENVGIVEHSLVVVTPDGGRDWIHLHASPGATAVATYQLDEPGTYPVLCTVPGHTEGGMIGELVVRADH